MSGQDILLGFGPLGLVLIGAVLGLACNYWLQQRVNRRRAAAAELKQWFYGFLELVADYWVSGDQSGTSPLGLQAKIRAHLNIILIECLMLAKHSHKLKIWYHSKDMFDARGRLIAIATGGSFLEPAWQSDPARVSAASREITRIIDKLHEAS